MAKVITRCGIAGVVASALTGASHAGGEITPFTEEAVARGLVYSVQSYGTITALGFGVAIADLTGNGHQDIVLMGASSGIVGFFENNSQNPGHFIDRSYQLNANNQPVPIQTLTLSSGIAIADFNGDGLLDVYLTQEMNQATGQLYANVLLRNEGDFNFTDVTIAAGVGNNGHSHGAAWGDFDNDGWLDLYLANYAFPQYVANPAHWNKLYRNLGNGSFQEVSAAMGVADKGMTFTPVFTDINRNGWLDLYIANDRGHYGGLPPNQLWRNNGGTFENLCGPNPPSTDGSGACVGLWAMCVGAGDVTGNGYPDFYVSNIAHPAGYNGWNAFLVNQGDETFVEQCPQAGVCSLATAWAGIFFDYDNNGWLDIYVCNQVQPNRLYSNKGGAAVFPMTDVAAAASVTGSTGWSYNAAVGDVTGNGALDILLNNYGLQGGLAANVQLFINHEGLKRNWMRFDVAGLPGSGNRHAIGANIEVTTNSGDGEAAHVQWREIYAGGNNYKAQNELVFHFGMGEAVIADQIVVNWPGGEVQRTLTNYPANTRWTIYPPQVLGDYNGDSAIGVADLLGLLQAWGPLTPGNEIMDLTGDGQVGVGDLLALLAKWGS